MSQLLLPAYATPDLWLDAHNAIQFVCWKDEREPYMAYWWHAPGAQRRADDERDWCLGAFQWRKPDERILGALWDMHSLDPLDVSPSLLCLACGAHGFIEQGRWRPV